MRHARRVITTVLLAAAAPACGFDPTLVVSCDDGVMNGAEAGVDCGGVCPNACPTVTGCMAPADCESRVCVAGECLAASCEDGAKNGAEGDVDCGVICDRPCADHQGCTTAGDCTSGVCAAGRCLPGTCGDGTKNADESDVDCGGACQSCDNGKSCTTDDDCASRACVGGSCSVWVKAVGPLGNASCNSGITEARAMDTQGNVFAAGKFSGVVSFGGPALDAASGDVYYVKYAANGAHLWSKNLGSGSPGGTFPGAAAFDALGNVFVAGATPDGDFGGGLLQGPGVFVAKYSASGDHAWSELFDASSALVCALATDSNGDVLVAGEFGAPMLIGTTLLDNPIPTLIPFVAKLAGADGSVLWAMAPSSVDRLSFCYGVAVDAAGDAFVTGYSASARMNFGCGVHDALYGSEKAFVAKLDGATGGCVWSRLDARTTGGLFGAGVVVDTEGNVILSGPIDTTLAEPKVFIDKYAGADGTMIWSRPLIDGVDSVGLFPMALDAADDVVISGRYRGAAPDFGGGPLINASPGTFDVFLAKYASANGAHLHSRRYGGTGDDFARGLGVSPSSGGAVLMGLFQDSVDFGTGALQAASPCSAFFLGMGSLPGGGP